MADVLEQLRTALGDRYELERLVGEGGMATVYLARDKRHGRQVAIKTLRAELAASIGADRFLREIQVAAILQHPNVLALYDSGEADGVLYYVMPFVEGESLRDRLNREQQLPLQDAVRIIREAAEALAYAHEHGVIHRDIKPENILLQKGHALVADFGIARALDAAGEKLTQTGMAVGTPHYMSPEQALGGDHADARSDVYSLGCVLYELLAGQPPFDGPNSMAILARHAMEQVPSLRIVRQSVPEELEEVVLQALEKTPADRFQTMAELVQALAEIEPLVLTRRSTGSRGVVAVRRSTSGGGRRTTPGVVEGVRRSTPQAILGERWGTGLRLWSLSAIAVVLLGVAGLTAWRAWLGPAVMAADSGLDPNRIAVLYFQSRGGSDSLDYLADGLTEALIHELSAVKPLQVISANGVAPFRNVAVTPDSVGRALKVGTLVQGTVVQGGDRLRVTVALVNPANGTEIGSKTLERPREQIFALQEDIAREVSLFLRQRLGQEVQLAESRTGTRSMKAWELFQRGLQEVKAAEPMIASGDTAVVSRQFARADSLFAEAETADPRWSAPVTQRGWLAYRHARLAGSFDKAHNEKWTRRGLTHAGRALALKSADPDALELRGMLQYWRALLNLEPEPEAGAKLLADAEQDFRGSVAANPAQASAWSMLSHLLINKGEPGEGKLAALRAYEADPYLTNVNLVLWRLAASSTELEDAVEAKHWCAEGRRRFPGDPRFAECQILLMSIQGERPDVGRAWQLLEEYVRLNPANAREFRRREGQMLVALAIARAGLADSARAVALRARADATVDPTRDLAMWESYVHTLLGDRDEAFRQLSIYVAANPLARSSLSRDQSWFLRDLREDPRWKSLIAGTP